MDVNSIVLLSQRGRLTYCPEKEIQIEQNIAYHLRTL